MLPPVLLLPGTPCAPLQKHAQLQMPFQLPLLPLLSPGQLLSCLEAQLPAAAAVEPVMMPAATAPPLRLLHPAAAMVCT